MSDPIPEAYAWLADALRPHCDHIDMIEQGGLPAIRCWREGRHQKFALCAAGLKPASATSYVKLMRDYLDAYDRSIH